jgi:hypothetical protein
MVSAPTVKVGLGRQGNSILIFYPKNPEKG